jgi:Uma2 family endonuclease
MRNTMSTLAVPRVQKAGPSAAASAAIVVYDHEFVFPSSAMTFAGFRTWAKSGAYPERGRVSYLGDEVYIDTSQEELETHSKVKLEVLGVVRGINLRLKIGVLYGDGALVSNEEARLSTIPDSVLLTYEALESGRVRLVPREGVEGQYIEVEGTPDWVMEIVSNSSVRKDTRRLRELYHRAGIPEYWLIDARGDTINFQILLREEDDYVPSGTRAGWQRSRLFGRRFRLVRERGRLDLWEYTLQVKPLR